ncbi:MAG: PQQ-like beta-propeller repeat protein [Armatimonadetes bacterium]|nr:PQQ-like beta-propeller repeat protein [Armatimonadota bacterium]
MSFLTLSLTLICTFTLIITGVCASDWPVYRHDTALSGVSPGKGNITDPVVLWEYYLGAPPVAMAADRPYKSPYAADLDGDGRMEQFALDGKTITVSRPEGKRLWAYTVDGFPLGGNVKVCKLFPERKGLQIISFSSRMDNGEGQGYCFSFEKGVESGELAWTTGPLTGQYAPTLLVDDVDGDGLPEIVTAPHYRVQIFDGQTGKLKAEVPWEVGRNYGVLVSRPRQDRPQKDIFIVCDFVLHVDCIRFEEGKWTHAWGHKYFEPNSPVPKGREQYIRAGPNPVADLDRDGFDEMAYMLVDAARDDQWHLRVRDTQTGNVKADIAGVWLWTIADLDGDGFAEIAYTPTAQKRPGAYCDIHIARLQAGKLADRAVLRRIRPLIMNAVLPDNIGSIADEGLMDWLRADVNGDGLPELLYAVRSRQGRFEDKIHAVSLLPDGGLKTRWRFSLPGHRLNVIQAGPDETGSPSIHIRDLTANRLLTVDATGKVAQDSGLGRPGGFATLPIVADLDGDRAGEIVLQNAAGEIIALKATKNTSEPLKRLWSVPGVAMSHSPGYAPNGWLCPQAADVDGDGQPEIVYAAEDKAGMASLVCADRSGKVQWRRSIEGCPWGGLQAGINLWTFGRFTRRGKGLDIYVDIHRRAKGSSEGWMLRGDTGEVVWRRQGLIAKETAMPFGGGMPAVFDVNGDGCDDLAQAFWTVYGVLSGDTGKPLFPPAFMTGPDYFGQWLAYSWPTVADLNGDGRPEAYLNSASYARGGYAAVRIDGKPLWVEFHDNDEGSDGLGPVGDFDGDGRLEIGVPVLNGSLLCLNAADGTRKWKTQSPVTGDVIAADINGDGVQELIFSGKDGKLRAVSGRDGREVWAIPLPGRPIVGDIDGDGLLEVLAVGHDGVLRAVGNRRSS